MLTMKNVLVKKFKKGEKKEQKENIYWTYRAQPFLTFSPNNPWLPGACATNNVMFV